MVNFTFFEIHLHDADLTTNAPFSSSSPDEAEEKAETGSAVEVEEGSQEWFLRMMVIAAVVGFVAVLVAWRLLKSGSVETAVESEEEEPVELEV